MAVQNDVDLSEPIAFASRRTRGSNVSAMVAPYVLRSASSCWQERGDGTERENRPGPVRAYASVMISIIMSTQFGMGVNVFGVRFDQFYELRAGTLVHVWCDLGGLARGSDSPDLSCWDMRNDRSYPAVFDFRIKRESDRR